MLICIDAGHGRYTAGKRCLKSIDPQETREWVLNSRIADKVQELLTGYNCKTMRVDDVTGETDISLANRVKAANKANADVYVSIHHNAGISGRSGGGIVVFAPTNGSKTTYTLQDAVYKATAANTGLTGNRSDPTPEKNWYVIYHTNMPAILGEFGFMDSTTDTPMILTEEFADQVAHGIVEALVNTFGLEEMEMSYETWKQYMEQYRAELASQPATLTTHVKEAVDRGITTGERPCDLATREEVMAMVKNAIYGN
jgi:N-acetylmuramoyl-L-alanine amidase